MPEDGTCEPFVYKPVYKVPWAESCEKQSVQDKQQCKVKKFLSSQT